MTVSVKTKHVWPYKGNMQELSDYLFKRIEYVKVTLVMTQTEYGDFYEDTCVDGNLSASRFRALDLENTKKPEWLFDGKLKLIIKVK